MLRRILLLVMLIAPIAALAAGPDDARQFVDSVGKKVLAIVNGGGAETQKQQQLQQMFSENVDINWMAQFVLGRGWAQASEEQRSRYLQVYKQYLLARYTTNFADYAGSKYTINGAKDDGNGQYLVSMSVVSPNAQDQETQAGYRVRGEGGQYKIADIIVEGVSLITTQRSEFSAVLQQKGMDGLISAIEAKNGK